ncbi:MAG: hypothetical protein ACK5Y6_02750 [Pseudomonadota bacterium]
MPIKLQLKLLSDAGELLSVVTCHAGKIAVLRASTPSDLRPYQRALGGSSGKDFIRIEVDGSEYRPERHTLIGFGEPSPTVGLSVHDFLANQGVSELAIAPLLLSLGLEEIANKQCSELTTDQEARLRILAATTDPNKVLVTNDPFEHIGGKWRERAAELLTNFARYQGAIAIVPFLSYRPECWIDNETIERIEVGHTTQRTIGFGTRGSSADDVISQIRGHSRPEKETQQAVSASIAAGMTLGTDGGENLSRSQLADRAWRNFRVGVTKTVCILAGAGFATWGAFSLGKIQSKDAPKGADKHSITSPSAAASASLKKVDPADAKSAITKDQPPAAQNGQASTSGLANTTLAKQPEPETKYILDLYPEQIRASLLDTARGIRSYQQPETDKPVAQPQAQTADQGNLFSLLAKASSDKSAVSRDSSNSDYESNSSDDHTDSDSEYQESEEEQRREEIRQRFLEAIRASAERRRMAAEEMSAE